LLEGSGGESTEKMGMLKGRQGERFQAKPLEQLWVFAVALPEDFDGYGLFAVGLPRDEDFTHSSQTQRLFDPITVDDQPTPATGEQMPSLETG
jgi:hypothetical protein